MDFGLLLVIAFCCSLLLPAIMKDIDNPPGCIVFARIIVLIACILLLLFLALVFYLLVFEPF